MIEPSARCHVVVVDARDPRSHPLREILESLSLTQQPMLAPDIERALALVATNQHAIVLIHAGLGMRPGVPAAGPLIAALGRHVGPARPIALYTSAPSPRLANVLAQLGVSAPILADQRLAASGGAIVRDLEDHAAALEGLAQRQNAAIVADPVLDRLPSGFAFDAFLEAVDAALEKAVLREHPDRTQAAAAIGVPLETFDRELRRHDLAMPRGRRPDSMRGPSVLWCSNRPAPEAVVRSCDAADVSIRIVPPGSLHPATVVCSATRAALVEAADPGSAFDLYLLDRSVRPYLLLNRPSAPVRLLLEGLGLPVRPIVGDVPVALLLRAGNAFATLCQDDPLRARLAYRRSGLAAWPIPRAELRRTLNRVILTHAFVTEGTNAAAADAVSLDIHKFRRRRRENDR